MKQFQNVLLFSGLFVAVLSIGGCASIKTIPYAAAEDPEFSPGYSETKQGENEYIITVRGYCTTNIELLDSYLIRRANEVCAPLKATIGGEPKIIEDFTRNCFPQVVKRYVSCS